MIGVTHIGTVTAQGTEDERLAMLRVMGAGVVDDTQEVERLLAEVEILLQGKNNWAARAEKAEAERDTLQARVSELEAERDAMVAAAYEAAAKEMADYGSSFGGYNATTPEEAASEIRTLTPADAKAALDRLINERVQAALAAQGAVTVKPLFDERRLHDLWTMGNCRMSFEWFKGRILAALTTAQKEGGE